MKTRPWWLSVLAGSSCALAALAMARVYLSPWRSVTTLDSTSALVSPTCEASLELAHFVATHPRARARLVVVPVEPIAAHCALSLAQLRERGPQLRPPQAWGSP